jgi:hypothetical protein
VKRETEEILDLMQEALEPVPFNLLAPPALSAYSEDDLLNMVADLLCQPPTPLNVSCLAAINSEFIVRQNKRGFEC